MSVDSTTVAGIEIPSTDPIFLALVGIHILLGLVCVAVGAAAILSEKRRGRHSTFGATYFWCLVALFASATLLSVMRWVEDSISLSSERWRLDRLGWDGRRCAGAGEDGPGCTSAAWERPMLSC